MREGEREARVCGMHTFACSLICCHNQSLPQTGRLLTDKCSCACVFVRVCLCADSVCVCLPVFISCSFVCLHVEQTTKAPTEPDKTRPGDHSSAKTRFPNRTQLQTEPSHGSFAATPRSRPYHRPRPIAVPI